MQIHTLKLKKRKSKKTIGRGGKKGTYSGRGNKGQKSRSGASINPLFEGGRSSLTDRMKKKRGFKSVNEPFVTVNLAKAAKKIADADIIDIDTLIKLNIIKKKDANRKVKLVGTAAFKHPIKVDEKILMSQSAKQSFLKNETTEKKSDKKAVTKKVIKKDK